MAHATVHPEDDDRLRSLSAGADEQPNHEDNDDEDEDTFHEGVKINPRLLGCPIEEVDVFITEDTFCVLCSHYGTYYVNRFSCSKSLFLFSPLNRIRRLAISIVTTQWFDVFIILTILSQCILLASDHFKETPVGSGIVPEGVKRMEEGPKPLVDLLFLLVYTFELILKLVAKGFLLNKFAYLRNNWNILDFVCVIAGWLTLGLEYTDQQNPGNLDFLRTLRVLRAVKTISILPGLRTMINALLKSIVKLIEVFALTFFCLIVFSLVGLQMFMGKLLQKCVVNKGGVADLVGHDPINPNDTHRHLDYYHWIHDNRNWLQRDFPVKEFLPCGNDSFLIRTCPTGYTCLENLGDNPDNGWMSFDTFFASMLTTFHLISLDYWERPYELVMSTKGWISLLFFITVVFLGYFYLLNLMLAVVAMSYEEAVASDESETMTKFQKLSLHRQDSSFSFHEPAKLKLKIMTTYKKKIPSERELLAKKELHINTDSRHSIVSASPSILNLDVGRKISGGKTSKTDEKIIVLPKESSQSILTISQTPSNPKQDFRRKIRVLMKKFKVKFKPLVTHRVFEIFITICIILNTIIMSTEHHNSSEILVTVSEYANYIFTGIFTLELSFKLLALQKDYFKSGWNLFDLLIVTASWVEIVVVAGGAIENGAAFGSLRLLRIFKLANNWITMKVLLNIIFATMGALCNLIIVVLLVIYIFAVLGMQFVGEGYTQKAFCGVNGDPTHAKCEGEKTFDFPTWRFDHFGYAFMMIFRILCGEWIEAMWECLTAQEPDPSLYPMKSDGKWKCFVIFILGTVVGTFIVLNLFLALLLNSFNTEELNAQREKELEASGKVENMKTIVGLFMKPKEEEEEQPEEVDKAAEIALTHVRKVERKKKFKMVTKRVIMRNRKAAALTAIEKGEKAVMRLNSKTSMENKDSLLETSSTQVKVSSTPDRCCPERCWGWNILGFSEFIEVCCCWKVWDRIRKICLKVVTYSYFEWFILFLIFSSSIALCFDDVNLENNKNLQLVLFNMNTFFTIVFIIEMLLKLTALGFWKYFTNFWCLLDAFIVIVNLVLVYLEIASGDNIESKRSNLGALKALRALRAFRPLRAISRWQGMKVVVNALIYSIPAIINVLLVCLLFWLVFSIMGVQLFKGRFYRCINDRTGELVPYREEHEGKDGKHVYNFTECCELALEKGFSWVNFDPNFDNVFEAYLSLYQIATFEGWMEIMKLSVDIGRENENHKTDRQLWYHLFYVVFIVLGSFFTLNLFIGVIIDNFNMLKKKYEGNLLQVFLTPTQRQYYTAMKKLGRKKPKRVITRPMNNYIALFYDIAISQKFEMFIFLIIFLNMIAMGFDEYNQSQFNTHILKTLDFFFITIYILEFVIKVIGFRYHYFTVGWNIFDFILISVSIVETFFFKIEGAIDPAIIRVVRVFRIGRILRFIKAAKGIRKLLYALIVSLPALYNIGALLALITFIYAILGMSFFGKAPKYDTYDDFFNFETFFQSCLVLLRLMTSAGWNEVYDALFQSEEPICGKYRKLKCGGPNEPDCINRMLMTGYMISYIAICWHIVINMYIAVILENFEEANKEEDIGIVEDDLDMFYRRWGRYDPAATQFISFDLLSEFLASLEAPLNIPKPNIVAIVLFNLPIARGNKIHCLDILHALVKHVIGHVDDSDDFRNLQSQMEKKFKQQFPQRKVLKLISSTRIWKIQNNASIVIQRAWRKYYARLHSTEIPIVKRQPLPQQNDKKKRDSKGKK